jgi:RNA polymerase sigma-70 factor (ECF subfamily)
MEGISIPFWKLIEPEHLRARAFCRKLIGNRDDGDDLYHDALIVAVRSFSQLRDRSAFRPWLYRILINKYRSRLRQPWWKRLVPITAEIAESIGGSDPVGAYAARRRLEVAFRAVSTEERALVTLFEMEGWTVAELSTLYGKNEGTIKMRLSRSRRKMREAITNEKQADKAVSVGSIAKHEDGICVAVRPSED